MNSDLYALSLSSILAALCYILMLPLVGFYNVFLTLFVCFTAGVLLGKGWGFLTGIVGMFLCSYFNPYGAALPPIMFAQMIGAGLSGVLGGITGGFVARHRGVFVPAVFMGFMGFVTALLYHIPVDITDAWLWGPFWPRLKLGLISSIVTIISNIAIFVILYPALKMLRRSIRYRI